jgi:hypothetical protein
MVMNRTARLLLVGLAIVGVMLLAYTNSSAEPKSPVIAGKTVRCVFIAPTGAAAGSWVRITGESEDANAFDCVVSGPFADGTAIRNAIKAAFPANWQVYDIGTNGIMIEGFGATMPYSRPKTVTCKDNQLGITVGIEAILNYADGQAGQRTFVFECDTPNASAASPGILELRINGSSATAALAANDTPPQAAAKLAAALTAKGYVAGVSGSSVTLDWEDPVNKGKLGQSVDILFGLNSGAAGPRLGINTPVTRPVIPTLTEWGLIILAVLAIGAVIWTVVRRRRVLVPA